MRIAKPNHGNWHVTFIFCWLPSLCLEVMLCSKPPTMQVCREGVFACMLNGKKQAELQVVVWKHCYVICIWGRGTLTDHECAPYDHQTHCQWAKAVVWMKLHSLQVYIQYVRGCVQYTWCICQYVWEQDYIAALMQVYYTSICFVHIYAHVRTYLWGLHSNPP